MEICFEKHDKGIEDVDIEKMYHVGNVIKRGPNLYLVANCFGAKESYSLINLSSGEAVNYAFYDSPFKLGKQVSRKGDILVTDVKVAAYTE